MSDQLRGLVSLFAVGGVLLGMAICDLKSADVTILMFIGFFFLTGVVLRFGESKRPALLALATLFPPLLTVLYLRVAFAHLGCGRITGGHETPRLSYLGELLLYALVLEWLGFLASATCSAIAGWLGSAAFVRLLDKVALRAKRLGLIVDEITRIGKLVSALKNLFSKGAAHNE